MEEMKNQSINFFINHTNKTNQMKQLVKMLVPAMFIFLLTACGSNDTTTEQLSETDKTTNEALAEQPGKAVINNADLNTVYEQYAQLTDAFTREDMAGAKQAATSIEAGAKDIEGAQSIAASAATIAAADNIEAQRTAYLTMSNDLITLVKKSGMKDGELYVEHCPMAFNNTGGSWISSNKEIRNPYFGDKMMKCGEVIETIQ